MIVVIGGDHCGLRTEALAIGRTRSAPSQNLGRQSSKVRETRAEKWASGPAPIADRGAIGIGYFARSDALLNLAGDLSQDARFLGRRILSDRCAVRAKSD